MSLCGLNQGKETGDCMLTEREWRERTDEAFEKFIETDTRTGADFYTHTFYFFNDDVLYWNGS